MDYEHSTAFREGKERADLQSTDQVGIITINKQ